MSTAAKAGSAFWRQAGMSYLQYVGVSTRAVRNSLKVGEIKFHFVDDKNESDAAFLKLLSTTQWFPA